MVLIINGPLFVRALVTFSFCPMTTHKWQFAPRFKRNAYGWKSDTPILRSKEALAEIKGMSKKEPVAAAEGAVLFLEKQSPGIEHVDSCFRRSGP